MGNMLLSFLSHDYSGLVIAALILALGVAGFVLLKRRVLRWFFGAVVLTALVLGGGAVSHLVRISSIDSRFPPPGRMVDVGGHAIHILAEGPRGGPAIVWFGGGHSGGLAAYDLHRRIRGEARSILIDRPGTGWSDAGPFPRTTAGEVEEVMRALAAAGETGPFVFVGHSFGGLLAANIARRHPRQTAALVLLDATPLDVVLYGADKKGMGALGERAFFEGLRRIFGFYRSSGPGGRGSIEADPSGASRLLDTHARASFAEASIYAELAAAGLVGRAWDTMVYDGELGDMPLYLVAPRADDSIAPYAEGVVGPGPAARRFERFLFRARERYMAASSRSRRVYAPAGTHHNFPAEAPGFVVQTLRGVLADLAGAAGDTVEPPSGRQE